MLPPSQSVTHSNYKYHATYKYRAASGTITFMRELYEKSILEKEIVTRSGILYKNICDDMPSFLGCRAQLTEEVVKESKTVPSVQIYVERAIARIKKFKSLNHIL